MHLVLTYVLLLVANFLDVFVDLEDVTEGLHLVLLQLLLAEVDLLDLSEHASELCHKADSTRQVTVLHLQLEALLVHFINIQAISG